MSIKIKVKFTKIRTIVEKKIKKLNKVISGQSEIELMLFIIITTVPLVEKKWP